MGGIGFAIAGTLDCISMAVDYIKPSPPWQEGPVWGGGKKVTTSTLKRTD